MRENIEVKMKVPVKRMVRGEGEMKGSGSGSGSGSGLGSISSGYHEQVQDQVDVELGSQCSDRL